jgi:folylpolyglutamate synthase
MTILAFHVFLQEKVDTAIIEVGVGGKLDSTNIIPYPIVTAISSIGLDHVAVLGNTIQKIALQKSGIYKVSYSSSLPRSYYDNIMSTSCQHHDNIN